MAIPSLISDVVLVSQKRKRKWKKKKQHLNKTQRLVIYLLTVLL
jgi:hypothetical protein